MRKFMIRTDLEGVSGIVSYEQAVPGGSEYQEGRALFMGDLLAAIEGLFEGGADEIWLYDEHCTGRNIRLDELPENVFACTGKTPYTETWAGALDSTFEGLILLGFHSKADRNAGRLLNHTYDLNISNIDVNGISVGEIGMEAAIAGEMGVPLLMVTADSAGISEAVDLVPEVTGVSVKESITEFAAVCCSTSTTTRKIREAAKKAAQETKHPEPFHIKAPVTMKVDFYPGPLAQIFAKQFGEAVYTGDSVLSCFARFQKEKAAAEALL